MDAPKPRWWRRLFTRRRARAYATLYAVALVAGCASNLTDRLVMIPSTQPIRLNDIERTSITAGPDRSLDLFRNRGTTTQPTAFALEFGGNAERAEEVASFRSIDWGDREVESFAVNYPGYGNSTGPARLKTAAESGLIAYDWLRKRAGGRPIYLVGNSVGTTVALHVAANRPDVAGLILTNPPPLRRLILGRFGWWNLWLAAGPIALGVPGELDSVANGAKCRMPAIFVTSADDGVVPVGYQRRVVDAYAGPKQVELREGGHNTPWSRQTGAWVTEQLDRLDARRQG